MITMLEVEEQTYSLVAKEKMIQSQTIIKLKEI